MKTENDFSNNVANLFVKPEGNWGRMIHALLGIASESGELCSEIKAHWIYGRPLDQENIVEECGDLLFYIEALLQTQHMTIESAMRHNIIKLAKRYPDGYSDENAIKRADKE